MAVLSVAGLAFFIWQELRVEHPAVDLRVLRYRSLSAGSFISLVVGMGLYGTIFVIPIFAQTVLQFTATKDRPHAGAGSAGLGGGHVRADSFLEGRLAANPYRPRVLITIGVMFAFMGIIPTRASTSSIGRSVWRGFGTVIMFMPLSIATLGSLPKRTMASGAAFQPDPATGRQHRHRGDHHSPRQATVRAPRATRLRRLRPQSGVPGTPERGHFLF